MTNFKNLMILQDKRSESEYRIIFKFAFLVKFLPYDRIAIDYQGDIIMMIDLLTDLYVISCIFAGPNILGKYIFKEIYIFFFCVT